MGKIIVLTLMLIASVGGGIYYVTNQNKPVPVTPISSGSAQIVNKTSPTPSIINQSTTDESIDSDITALDKDLAGLEQSDPTLTNDINGL